MDFKNDKMVKCHRCGKTVSRSRAWFRHSEMEDAWIMTNPYVSDKMMDRILCGPCYLEEGHRKPSYVERKLKFVESIKEG